jgi:tellurite methyltransferase
VAGLAEQFGQIDIYLFDQLLRGRIKPGMRILDAGCGGGRNLVYFFRNAEADGYQVFGNDKDPAAITSVQRLARTLAPTIPPDSFRVETNEANSFPEGEADVVISSAVLHFARDDEHFEAMLQGSWKPLRPGGLFFCRLASSTGIEREITRVSGRRYFLPDGSERYLVDDALLVETTARLGASLIDPIKTTVVQNQRAMSTWILRKDS